MATNDTVQIIDAIEQMTEMLSGFRNNLINHGYSPDIAEQLVLEIQCQVTLDKALMVEQEKKAN